MKIVPLKTLNLLKSRDLFLQVVGQSPAKALTVEDIRLRNRVTKAIKDTEGDEVQLEDGDWVTLKKCVNEFPYTVATPELEEVIDDVLKAVAPPKVVEPPENCSGRA